MNSRKWQVGMTAVVLVSVGVLAPFPFVWRYLRLREKITGVVLGVVSLLWTAAWVLTGVDTDWAALPIIFVWAIGSVAAAWLFRPLTKTEQTNDWRL